MVEIWVESWLEVDDVAGWVHRHVSGFWSANPTSLEH